MQTVSRSTERVRGAQAFETLEKGDPWKRFPCPRQLRPLVGTITYAPALGCALSMVAAKPARAITMATFASYCSPGLGAVLKATPVLCHLTLPVACEKGAVTALYTEGKADF